jgi:hypothetical protein
MKINFAFCILHCVLPLAAMIGCSRGADSVVADVNRAGWARGTEYSVVYYNRDSLSERELSIFVLHDRAFAEEVDYPVLTIETTTPDSLTFSEKLTFRPDMPDGKNLLHETVRPYRSHVILSRKGLYTFTFSHNNYRAVEGVRGIGLQFN